MNNYKVIKEKKLVDIASNATLLVHNKTNAKVLLIENDDENKTFCIGFRTPPKDDTGVPHIIEHSVLCGSKKYPVKEPFVNLMKSSLNTFLNAMTFSDKTIYPVASCNDKDFQNLMDVYLDAVFFPNILTNKKIFMQEGWHYELASKDDELIYNGVVYNEMKGVFSNPDSIVGRESGGSLFPDTTYGVESGGDPKAIPTLTYENFKKFYQSYYHPSNSYIILYGNFDREEKLDYLDKEYLSKFDKIDVDSKILEQKPFDAPLTKTLEYPVSKDQDIKKKTYLTYNVALPKGLSQKEMVGMDIVSKVIVGANGSPIERALIEAGIGEVITGSFDNEALQGVFSVKARNAEAEDKDKFFEVIENKLKDFVKEGLSKKALEAALNINEFKTREADYGGLSKGVIYAITALSTWLYDDNDPFSPFEYSEIYNFLREKIATDYYEKLIEKYLINNNHKSVVVVAPSKTLQDEKEAKVKKELADYKSSLNDKEIEEIIKETKELKEYQASEDKKEDVDKIPLLKKEDLNYNYVPYKNEEYKVNGAKVIHHAYDTNGINYTWILFSTKDFDVKYLPYIGLLSFLLGKVNTKKYSYLELEQEQNIYTGGIGFNHIVYSKDGEALPYLIVSFSALYANTNKAIELINEVINNSVFDKARVKEVLSQLITNYTNRFAGAGHSVALTRSASYWNKSAYISDATSGIAGYNFVKDLSDNFDEKYDDVINTLKDLISRIFVLDNILVSSTSSSEGLEEFKKSFGLLTNNLKETSKKEEMIIKLEKKNEGFMAPYDVNYCALTGRYVSDDMKYKGSSQVLMNALSTDFLWKNVRVLGGAYGCMSNFDRESISFVSYRDPKVKETYDVYKKVLDYIDNFNADSEEMTKCIIGAVGNFDYPVTPKVRGIRSFASYLQGVTNEDLAREKREIVDCTLEDIKALKPYFEKVLKENNICTVGNSQKITDSKELFSNLENLIK